jgi:hypothetical protein
VKHEVFQCVETPVGIGTLRNDPDSLSYLYFIRPDIGTGDKCGARSRSHSRRQNPDGRCLSGAVWPDHPEELAFVDVEVE